MKAPKPTIPRYAPKGTTWYGGPIEWFVLRLEIRSRDLIPSEVTRLLGCEPDDASEAGKPLGSGSAKRTKFGQWSLELRPENTDEWDCGEAMWELLQRLPSDVGLWKELTRNYQVNVTFALLMTSSNKGFALPPEIMSYLGTRGIAAGFDIYYEGGKNAEPDAAPMRRPTSG